MLGKLALGAAKSGNTVEAQAAVSRMEFAFGRNLNEFYSTRIGTVLAIVGIITSAIRLSESNTGLEKAMNGLLLTSSLLKLIAAAGGWALSLGVAEGVSTTLSTLFGLASGLSFIAAIAGCIILLIILTSKKDPQTPLEKFVSGQAEKGGYRMTNGIEVDYFQVTKTNDQVNCIGVTFSENDEFTNCIKVLANNTFEISALTNASNTVWEIATDQFGYAEFATFVFPDARTQNGVFIKLKNGKVVAEGTTAADANEHKWICEVSGHTSYTTVNRTINGVNSIEKHLMKAVFTIKNVDSFRNNVNDYLNIAGGNLVVRNTPKKWS